MKTSSNVTFISYYLSLTFFSNLCLSPEHFSFPWDSYIRRFYIAVVNWLLRDSPHITISGFHPTGNGYLLFLDIRLVVRLLKSAPHLFSHLFLSFNLLFVLFHCLTQCLVFMAAHYWLLCVFWTTCHDRSPLRGQFRWSENTVKLLSPVAQATNTIQHKQAFASSRLVFVAAGFRFSSICL